MKFKKYLTILIVGLVLVAGIAGAQSWSIWGYNAAGGISPYEDVDIGSNTERISKIWLDDLDAIAGTFGTLTISSVANGPLIVGTSTDPDIRFKGDANTGFSWITDDEVGLMTGGTNRLVVDSSGNVGVGTSTPKYQFETVGTSTDGFFGVSQNDAGDLLNVDNTGNTNIGGALDVTATTTLGGHLGIGITTPTASLSIKSGGLDSRSISLTSAADSQDLFVLKEDAGGDMGLYMYNALGAVKVVLNADGQTYFNGGDVGISTASNIGTSVLTVKGGYVHMGDTGAVGFANGEGDVYIQKDLEVDGTSYLTLLTVTGTSTLATTSVTKFEANDIYVAGNVGIGTTNPTYELDVAGNINAFAVYTRPDYKTAKDIYKPCPDGYILVPGSEKYGTADFCVMKYEAKECNFVNATTTDCSGQTKAAGSGDPADEQWAASYPENKPWITIQQDSDSAQEACSQIGTGFHLITNAEWMTIADNIIHTQINDLDKDTALFQLATGHTDNSPAASVTSTAAADPTVSGCNLNLSLEETANAYASTSCELRGNGPGDHSDNAHGYYGTEQNWSTTYTSGGSNASQLRTHVLSNGEVIWDLAGNVWEWTDDTMSNTHAIESSSGVTGWEGYFAADSDAGYLTNAQGFNIIPNISTSYTANNHGIGRIYIDVDDANPSGTTHAFRRGGYWADGAYAGVFTLSLTDAPANARPYLGFRCAR